MTTAIVAALPDELSTLLAEMGPRAQRHRHGQRDFFAAELWGTPCVAVLSRVGKVAAATTVASLIHEFKVERLIFVGVAGGLGPGVRVGDVVIGESLLQHDFTAAPLFPRFEIPLLGRARFDACAELSAQALHAAHTYLREDLRTDISPEDQQTFGLTMPAAHRGLIVSGDEFVHDAQRVTTLRADLPDALAVEMEGAAVAQVCHEFGLPFTVIRTISDRADASAHVDFVQFVRAVASRYAHGMLKRMLAR